MKDKYIKVIINNKEFLINKKSKINQTLAEQILNYRQQGFGTRLIQKELKINRSTIQSFYKLNNICNQDIRKLKLNKPYRKCKICKEIKENSNFRKRIRKNAPNTISYECYCFLCEQKVSKDRCKKYYASNKLNQLQKVKEYYNKNKSKILNYNKKYCKIKRKNNFAFRVRPIISNSIYCCLKNNNCLKSNSIKSKLPFKLEDLKMHLESLFEPWMNWNNWGKYIKAKWDDNDQSTWTWQIDHIIPHSTFKYKSMDDELFIKCWSLDNLRPYSSKLNQLDGCTKIRHE